jgi:hypothetical protein
LWAVGDRFIPAEPHALDGETHNSVSIGTLVKTSGLHPENTRELK